MATSITIKGVDKAMKKLGKGTAVSMLRKPMRDGLALLKKDRKVYAPERPNQTYARTGRLGKNVRGETQTTQNGLVGRIKNETPYKPYVHQRPDQAWMHRGRWLTDDDIVTRNQAAIVAGFERAIKKALR